MGIWKSVGGDSAVHKAPIYYISRYKASKQAKPTETHFVDNLFSVFNRSRMFVPTPHSAQEDEEWNRSQDPTEGAGGGSVGKNETAQIDSSRHV